MFWTYPKEYFCSQHTENSQLAPGAVPVDEQPLLSLVLSATTPEGFFLHPVASEQGEAGGATLTMFRPSAVRNIFLYETNQQVVIT